MAHAAVGGDLRTKEKRRYMYTLGGEDLFKHLTTRRYLSVPRQSLAAT